MALTCAACGGAGDGVAAGPGWACAHCGHPRYAGSRPLLVVTGAAAAGKSTACGAIARAVPGVLALDADVVARGAAATTREPQDYPAFWAHLAAIGREVQENGLTVAWCGICLPEQLPEAGSAGFARIELLVLTCDDAVLRARLSARPGGADVASRADRHVALNARLRTARDREGLRVQHVDTTQLDPAGTAAAATAWAATASA